ncbi:SPOR domain-containing protein [Leptospira kmetyi]|uniref:SPOR domain-containing protein n=1 Tax=Leptospira kmetyi TaxID=408139 RepID=A0A2M9XN16_9LEPT|nr:SPOR domain-containing protein [Leptospira kmetyi]AYV55297.1 SPOR domain-containing protein [Leptospira kmetyi]EQA51934.1 sporulation and cell division repeat protein [Leptospira kmetyi serovar Malaysia str. Bejo-Iso9]PJZ30984.1 SPOR domain-containing protein [Leptospira kmetyi]PJZ40689.1 SPOR domain-containing protein [Leptospira kmetyi]TGL70500.1 SPOR domain-containing protein [Leptospira kmetyi]
MKEKIFYVINLDNKRILILSIFLIGLLFSFFFLGVSVGKKRAGGSAEESLTLNEIKNQEVQSSIPFSEPGQIPAEGNNTVASAEIPAASVNSPSNTKDSVTFKNIPPATEVVEFKKSGTSPASVEKENKSAPETLSVKEPEGSRDSQKNKRNDEKKSKRVSSKSASDEESSGFTLQVAAFKEKEKADELKKSISGKEKNAKATVKKSRNGYYTVRFGSASSKKEAESLAKLLPAKLRSGVIVVKD